MDIPESRLRSENDAKAAACDHFVHLCISSSMKIICPGFTQTHRLGEGGFGIVYLANGSPMVSCGSRGVARCITERRGVSSPLCLLTLT